MCLSLCLGKEGSAAEWFEQAVRAEKRISSIADVPSKSCLSSVMSTMISFSGKLSQFHCSILRSDPSTPGLYTIPSALVNNCLHTTQELSPYKRLLPTLSGTQKFPSFSFCHDPLLRKGLPAFLPVLSWIVYFSCECYSPFFVALICTKIPTLTDFWNQKGRKRVSVAIMICILFIYCQ